jgi:PAS domain S-box-containing protein
LVSADQYSIGKIVHANEETEYLLGYKRQELLDKNINTI